jgi:NADPH:quinone reductase-like Zn-dependent oxidoreductase
MKAILFQQHGGPEVLEYTDFPTPEPGPGEVQIRLRAAALNRMDLLCRRGWPGLKLPMPHIPGADGAGEVSALGEGVKEFTVGQAVVINPDLSCGHCEYCLAGKDNMCREWELLGETRRGTYAEFIVLPAANLLPIPPDFGSARAAAAALVYLTAWHSLITRGQLRPGEYVLIVGASGGVNTASLQIAKLAGARVFVVGSDSGKVALAESLGADVLIDRSQEPDWTKAAFLASGRRGMDVVVDNVGAATMSGSLRAARKGGRVLTVGNTSGPDLQIDNRYIFARHLSVIGSTMGTRSDFAAVMQLVFEGRLQPVIDRHYPLEQAAEAQQRLEANRQMGKIVLDI